MNLNRSWLGILKLQMLLIWICTLTLVFTTAYAKDVDFKAEFQSILTHSINKSRTTPGAVLLVSDPTIGTIVVAAGYSDEANKTPMTIYNNFRIASISKTFLAVTVMKLAEEDKINLDQKIMDYLPESIDINKLPNGKKVTVRQLLQMRSGIPNYTDFYGYSEFVFNHLKNYFWHPEDGIRIIYNEPPNFKPGEDYQYSNTNYLLLQAIVQNVMHTSYAEQIRKLILTPLKLDHTYVEAHEIRNGGFNGLITRGYIIKNKQLLDKTEFNDGFGTGDGGMVTTVQDLATFVQALLEQKTLLSPQMLSQMLTVKGPEDYGLGIYREKVASLLAWTHNGTSSGFQGQYYYFPDRKLTIVILTNSYDADIIDKVAEEVTEFIVNADFIKTEPGEQQAVPNVTAPVMSIPVSGWES